MHSSVENSKCPILRQFRSLVLSVFFFFFFFTAAYTYQRRSSILENYDTFLVSSFSKTNLANSRTVSVTLSNTSSTKKFSSLVEPIKPEDKIKNSINVGCLAVGPMLFFSFFIYLFLFPLIYQIYKQQYYLSVQFSHFAT